MMNFKKIEWLTCASISHTFADLFSPLARYEGVMVFDSPDGKWHLHYGCEDDSEHIYTGDTKEQVMAFAQDFHNENILREFFDLGVQDGEDQ